MTPLGAGVRLLSPEEYQARAAELFDAVAARVAGALPYARIEHVGASSIPGALSKGDLDLCVIVPPERFEASRDEIERLGYRVKSDTLRTSELCMLVPDPAEPDHAIQLVASGSKFEFFVTFRDALRADADAVRRYNQVKLDSAALGPKGYRRAKGRFIGDVLATRTD